MAGDATVFRLGVPQSGVVIARKYGLLPQQDEGIAEYPSVQLIHTLRELTDTRSALDEIEHDLYCWQLEQSMADLTHSERLEERMQQLNIVLTHFTELITGKGKLLARLQATSVQNSLTIEARYHKSIVSAIHSLNDILKSISSHCDRLDKANSQSLHLKGSNLEMCLASVIQSLSESRLQLHNCQDLHHVLQERDI